MPYPTIVINYNTVYGSDNKMIVKNYRFEYDYGNYSEYDYYTETISTIHTIYT